MPEYIIDKGYTPGSIGRIAELHGLYYHIHWNFGVFFEAKVATELSRFLMRYEEERDGLWTVSVNGRIEGALAVDGIDARTDGAHLRWFLLSDALRGKGAGKKLLETAMTFCRDKGYAKAFLWTFDGLHAARHLYEKAGFHLVKEQKGSSWGAVVVEQRLEYSWTGKA